MTDTGATQIFRLNLQWSAVTLAAATPAILALGLEPKEFFVLDAVEEHPYPAELAGHMSMPRPTIAAYLREFQKRGLVTRSIDEQDRRRHRLELTPDGKSIVEAARKCIVARYAETLDRLTTDEQRELAALFRKLTHAD
jgi:MarR family transcriptional regulator, organic hydroperoxide resistance regulator